MNAMAILMASVMLVTAQNAEQSDRSDATGVQLSNFVVVLIYDVRVPARESGVLTVLDAKKGQVVKKDEVLGQIDNSDALIRRLIAENELKAAETQAASDANVQAAKATILVAENEFEESKKIASRVRDAVSEFELRRQELTVEKSRHQATNAEIEHEINQYTRGKANGQLQAVENELQRRLITAPIDGVIVDRFHNAGEWAQAGEPIYRVIHMDRLRVEGMLNANGPRGFMPEEVQGSPVKIYVKTPENPEEGEVFDGRIDFVNQIVDPSGEFLVHAEFDNPRKPNGQWRVRPGLDAEIKILLQPKRSARDDQARRQ